MRDHTNHLRGFITIRKCMPGGVDRVAVGFIYSIIGDADHVGVLSGGYNDNVTVTCISR
jgi:hypothetical protein